jgi:hypothetical protein
MFGISVTVAAVGGLVIAVYLSDIEIVFTIYSVPLILFASAPVLGFSLRTEIQFGKFASVCQLLADMYTGCKSTVRIETPVRRV